MQTKGEAVDIFSKVPAPRRISSGYVGGYIADGTVCVGITNGGCTVV